MGFRKCGGCGSSYQTGSRLGSGPVPSGPKCECPQGKRPLIGLGQSRKRAFDSTALRASTQKSEPQNLLAINIAEQLELLASLRSSGALSEQEFQTVKNRLISGENS